jgi:hypothetical protein
MPAGGRHPPSCCAVRRRCAAQFGGRTRGRTASIGVFVRAGLPLVVIVWAAFSLSVLWSYGLP